MRLFKAVTGILLMFALFCPDAQAARIPKTLDANTRITPPGVIVAVRAEVPMFKKGTVVVLNEFGECLEGTLAENIFLPYESGSYQSTVRPTYIPAPAPQPPIIIPRPSPAPPPIFIPYAVSDQTPQIRALPFKGGTKVVFNDKGEVIRGTMSSGQVITLNPTNRIAVTDAEISFHPNGMVATCSLSSDTYLRPVGWGEILTVNFTEGLACAGFVEFKGGKPVELNDKGEVVKGTLNNETRLLSTNIIGTDSAGRKIYRAGTTVEFDSKGVVVKAQEN